MEIYIIRHGETYWNAKGLLQGRTDIELNEQGRELAGITGRHLEDTLFNCIYSSPLIRAYETACLIRGHRNIPILRDERLLEFSFGEYEGHSAKDLFHDTSDPFHYFFDAPDKFKPAPGGESFADICKRGEDFMRNVIEPLEEKEHPQRIMIVAHGAMNKSLMHYITQSSIADYWSGGLQKNCGVIIVKLQEKRYQVINNGTVFY